MKLTRKRVLIGSLLFAGLLGMAAIAYYQFSPQKRFARHIVKARIHANSGKHGPALTEYEKALALDDKSEVVLTEIGNVRMAMEQPDRAAEVYQQCIQIHPQYTRAWLGLIRARIALKDRPAIEDAATKLLALRRDAETLTINGDAKAACNLYDDAFCCYREAMGMAPNDYEPVRNMAGLLGRLRRMDDARALLQGYAARPEAKDKDRALVTVAESLFNDDRYQEGLEYLDQAIAIKSTPELQVRRAETLSLLKKFDKAREELETVFATLQNPVPQAYKVRAICLIESGDLEGALRDAQMAQRALPNDPQVALLLARIHFKNDRIMQAEEEARRALLIRPDFFPAQNFLMLMLLKKGRYDQAITLGRGLMERPRVNEAAMRLLVRAYLANNQPDEARQTFESVRQRDGRAVAIESNANAAVEDEIAKLLALDPKERDTASVQLLLGQAYMRAKKIPQALSAFETASRLDPKTVEPKLSINSLRLAMGQLEEAARSLEQVIAEHPGTVKAIAWLARIRTQQRNFPEAEKYYSMWLDTEPSSGEALSGMVRSKLARNDAAGLSELIGKLERSPISEQQATAFVLQALIQKHNDTPAALALIDSALALKPDLAIALHERALIHIHDGKLDQALQSMYAIEMASIQPAGLERLDFAVALTLAGKLAEARACAFEEFLLSKSPESLMVLVAAALKAGKPDEALKYIDSMPAHKLELVTLKELTQIQRAGEVAEKLILADMYARGGRHAWAFESMQAASEMAPQDPNVASMKASALVRMGKVEEGIAALNALVDAHPKRADFAVALADIQQYRAKPAEAIELYKKALAVEPTYQRGLSAVGTLLMGRGQTDGAAEYLKQALKLAPTDLVTLNNYIWVLAVDLKTPDKALTLADDLYRLAPHNSDALDTAGWVFFLNGKYEEAQKALDYGAQLAPGNGELAFHRGVVLHHNQRLAEALVELKRAKAIGGKLIDVALADRLITELETKQQSGLQVSSEKTGAIK
jgi:tetratricopeptide (TPR) repeat protein